MDGQPRIALVGEAWGADEEAESLKQGRPCPFVGAAGDLLNALLKVAALDREACLVTNVFNLRPPGNDLELILATKKNAAPGWDIPVRRGKYLGVDLLPELSRLYSELHEFQPELIIPLGGTALWAITGTTGIANRHGFLHSWHGIPTVPTYHPASILRKYSQFMPTANDIRRAVGFVKGEIQREAFNYNAEPTVADLESYAESIIAGTILAVDIETKPKFRAITSIGLGTIEFAVSIPFWDPKSPGQSYWASVEEEIRAREIIAKILEDPATTKVLQHAAYDIPWLKVIWGIEVAGPVIDTRLEHFALFPELPHNLAEMASTYLMMEPWKAIFQGSGKEGDTAGTGGESNA